MAQQRCIQLSTEKVSSIVHILGTELCLDIHGAAPRAATCFEIWATPGLNIYEIEDHMTKSTRPTRSKVSCDSKQPLDKTVKISVTMDAPSIQVDHEKIRVSYYEGNSKVPIAKAVLHITCIEMSLDADINRSGIVTRGDNQKDQWTWGPDGKGAVLLVNCDRDNPKAQKEDNKDNKVTSEQDLEDMSRMILTTQGPDEVFANYQLVLHIWKADGDKVRVFCAQDKEQSYKHVLGSGKTYHYVKRNLGQMQTVFYVEGLQFPDIDFPGLVTFHASLLEPARKGVPETSIFKDTLVFRVAPWIMTPNTLQPVSVYVCSIFSVDENKDFVQHIRKLARKAGCKFIICPEKENDGDRWIQDEVEFGYTQAPHKTFPVVFDSPRNRNLKDFPFKKILGPDFGYVKRELSSGKSPTTLDSFGNLEVSPPVTVKSKEYPLGRILIGASSPTNNIPMSQLVKDFLNSQVVQSPIELYTDWLTVGHVDEILSFVPAPDQKGFRLLLASPRACSKLLKEKEEEGHGKAKMPEGIEFQKGGRQPRSISEIIADEFLTKWNEYCQKCIDSNRKILIEELGLAEEDIIEIPQLFYPILKLPEIHVSQVVTAEAYFPDMVNMLVLGKHLGIPKPFGPIIDGQCCLEKEVRRLLEPLGLSCNFIDDYGTYFLKQGDVHCGTNVRRKPFSFKWWNMRL